MKKIKPVIGVTGPARGGTAAWLFTKLGVWMQGGRAVHITTKKGPDVSELDGLILGGGADVDPYHYGESRDETLNSGISEDNHRGFKKWLIRLSSFFLYPLIYLARKFFSVKSAPIDKQRDELELYYLERALELGLPVLGICRGAQLLNVKLGGTLFQDITGFYKEIPKVHSIFPRKQISLDGDSNLAEIMGTSEIRVNALHNQAIDKLASSLHVVAREQNGIIQAVESREFPFLVGVQWHPEYMPQISEQRQLFSALVQAAGDL